MRKKQDNYKAEL